MEDEFAPFQPGPHIVLDGPAALDIIVHLGDEETVIAAAFALAVVERHVGVAQGLFRVIGVLGEDRDADRRGAVDVAAVDLEGLLQAFEQFLRQNGDAVGVVGLDLDDPEFVTADSGHRVRCSDAPQKPLADPFQQRVAGVVAHGIVDVLEMVEVDQVHRRQLAGAPGMAENLFQPVLEQRPVGKAGQVVEIDDLLLGFLALGDVAPVKVDVIGIDHRLQDQGIEAVMAKKFALRRGLLFLRLDHGAAPFVGQLVADVDVPEFQQHFRRPVGIKHMALDGHTQDRVRIFIRYPGNTIGPLLFGDALGDLVFQGFVGGDQLV